MSERTLGVGVRGAAPTPLGVTCRAGRAGAGLLRETVRGVGEGARTAASLAASGPAWVGEERRRSGCGLGTGAPGAPPRTPAAASARARSSGPRSASMRCTSGRDLWFRSAAAPPKPARGKRAAAPGSTAELPGGWSTCIPLVPVGVCRLAGVGEGVSPLSVPSCSSRGPSPAAAGSLACSSFNCRSPGSPRVQPRSQARSRVGRFASASRQPLSIPRWPCGAVQDQPGGPTVRPRGRVHPRYRVAHVRACLWRAYGEVGYHTAKSIRKFCDCSQADGPPASGGSTSGRPPGAASGIFARGARLAASASAACVSSRRGFVRSPPRRAGRRCARAGCPFCRCDRSARCDGRACAPCLGRGARGG